MRYNPESTSEKIIRVYKLIESIQYKLAENKRATAITHNDVASFQAQINMLRVHPSNFLREKSVRQLAENIAAKKRILIRHAVIADRISAELILIEKQLSEIE